MEPIEETYFNWLCAQVLPLRARNYVDLLGILHQTEFTWMLPEDENRASEGFEVRRQFLIQSGLEPEDYWAQVGCSILEMIIGLARRAAFQTEIPVKKWVFEIFDNLGLIEYRRVSQSDRAAIDDILYRLIWRTYESDGHGGMFPVRYSDQDQREVEIWYQFCEYVNEKDLF